MSGRILYLHALSPVHSGTGSGVGIIDLPIARETHTGWPVLPGSSLKGALKSAARSAPGIDPALVTTAFGPDTANASEGNGALTITDGHVLCFPVRSLVGGFAWLTCPYALRRWARDHAHAGLTAPAIPDFAARLVATDGAPAMIVTQSSVLAAADRVFLEEIDFQHRPAPDATPIAAAIANAVFTGQEWQTLFAERFAIVSDDMFGYFVTTATEVTARVRLRDDSKTVANGALWWEEAAPAETIFSGPILAPASVRGRGGDGEHRPVPDTELFAAVETSVKPFLQLGGNTSVGRGMVAARLAGGNGQ